MTERAAADQIVDITRETATSDLAKAGTFGEAFVHDRALSASRTGQTRHFNVFCISSGKMANRNGRVRSDYRVLIDYLEQEGDAYELDRMINADAYTLSARYANPSNWETDTSTIELIVPEGDDLVPWAIEDVEVEAGPPVRRLVFGFAVEHKGQTPLL